MEFVQIIKRARKIKRDYSTLNKSKGNRQWGVAEYTQGFVGDVGDLVKLVMMKNGFRGEKDVDEKLAHELADCLWSVIVIADELGIDLEKEFVKTMDGLEERLKNSY